MDAGFVLQTQELLTGTQDHAGRLTWDTSRCLHEDKGALALKWQSLDRRVFKVTAYLYIYLLADLVTVHVLDV